MGLTYTHESRPLIWFAAAATFLAATTMFLGRVRDHLAEISAMMGPGAEGLYPVDPTELTYILAALLCAVCAVLSVLIGVFSWRHSASSRGNV
jgi:TRAP-type C4-dicarboxylate transport system permease small subunit